jgi:dTDP-4-amino-4,6-dideoxygalactose transaminase
MPLEKNFLHYGMHNISELKIQDIKKSLNNQFITNDKFCKKLEKKISKLTTSKYAVVCNNGTSALMMTILAKNKDNLIAIVPNINFVAIANIITLLKGKIVICDVNRNTGMIDADSFKETLSQCRKKDIKPNFFFPVHYAGDILQLKKFKKICDKEKINIIEDGCHSFGSFDDKGDMVGSCKYSLGTTFSFHPVKNITTIEGGAITTNNKKFYEKLKEIRSHSLRRTNIDDPYVLDAPSLNFRMGEINALIGLEQLKKLKYFKKKRLDIVKYYIKKFQKFEKHFQILNHNKKGIFWHLFVILFNKKSKITKRNFMEFLKKNKIGSQVHYKPIFLHKAFKQSIILTNNKNSLHFYKSQLSLPLHVNVIKKDVDYIYNIFIKFFKNYNLTL